VSLSILLGRRTLTSFHTPLFEAEMDTGVTAKRLQEEAIDSFPASFNKGIPKDIRNLKQRLVLIVNALDARNVPF